MEIEKQVLQWLKSMEYTQKIPKPLSKWCNPATFSLWDQVCTVIQPKEIVDNELKNLIISRLDGSNLEDIESWDTLKEKALPQIRQVEAWRAKVKIKVKCSGMNREVNTQEMKINDLYSSSNLKYIQLDNLKAELNEFKCKFHMLKKKKTQLNEEMIRINEKYSLPDSLMPADKNEAENSIEILNTLTKSAEKLETMITNNSQLNLTKLSHLSGSMQSISCSNLNEMSEKMSDILYSSQLRPKALFKHSLLKSATKNFYSSQQMLNISQTSISNYSLLDNTNCSTNVADVDAENILHSFARSFILERIKELYRNVIANIDLLDKETDSQSESDFSARDAETDFGVYYIGRNFDLRTKKYRLRMLEKKVQAERMQFELETPPKCKEGLKLMHEAAILKAQLKCRKTKISKKEVFAKILSQVESDNKRLLYKTDYMQTKLEHRLSLLEDSFGQIKNEYENRFVPTSSPEVLDYMDYLVDDMLVQELDLLIGFPVEFNRRCVDSLGKTLFARDCLDHSFKELDKENIAKLKEVSTLIVAPSITPEVQLLNIIDKKLRVEYLKSLENVSVFDHGTKYDKESLAAGETYVEELHTSANTFLLDIVNKTRKSRGVPENLDFYRNMPVGNHISDTRLYKGKPYKCYEKLYEDLSKPFRLDK